MKKAKLVFVPSPGTGHLVSLVEFAKRILDISDTFSITILIIRPPGYAAEFEKYNNSFSNILDTRIQYITLPQVAPPDSIDPAKVPEYFNQLFLNSHKSNVKNAILNQVMSNDKIPIAGLVVDMFCCGMIDVAKEIQVPAYVFYTSSAAFLGMVMYLGKHHDRVGSNIRETDPDHDIPTYVNPVPSTVLPTFVFNDGYKAFVYQARMFKEAKGIIVNSFYELESYAFNSFQGSDEIPPVYSVGPLLNLQSTTKNDEIMHWLDDQPEKSVIFLCFGSMGSFEETQLKEIAIALERSGHPFLWSIRKKPAKDKRILPTEYENYDEFLPEGFLERTRETGLIRGWVPQGEVLGHKAIGAFVSHCGWNSILESVWHGVPIVTWPMYGEQQINAFEIVEDLGLAVAIRLDYRTNDPSKPCPLVMADEIVKPLEFVMQKESVVRDKIEGMSQRSRQALLESGSSVAQLQRFINVILANNA